MQTLATAAEIEKWLQVQVRFFQNILTQDPAPKKKHRILPGSTPGLRIRGHLW